MARGFIRTRLTSGLLIAGLILSACSDGGERSVSGGAASIVRGDSPTEREMRSLARAMQKTILQGTAAGAGAGGALDLAFGGDDDAGAGISIGAVSGASAGTYVALIQRKYTLRGRRLKQIQKDLDLNAEQMQQTLNIMKATLDLQKSELATLREQAAAGDATETLIARETAEAQSNLSQMNLAIQGATARQEEFSAARDLTKRRRQEESPIDPDLTRLSAQISEMKAIANDLAQTL